MAIGAIHLAWLRRLAGRNCFDGLRELIDLGPQDIQVERNVLDRAMRGVMSRLEIDHLVHQIYGDRTTPGKDAQQTFYRLFGLESYASIDVVDERATYQLDLSNPIEGLPEFGVVTNFGTTEHVFNVGEAFRSIHQLTKPGGISLHCVPCFAFINHGFYSINPNLFVEMARANDYELVDFSYFDNAFVRNFHLGRDGVEGFDFDTLPIQLEDMENTQTFMSKVVERYYRNLVAKETRETIAAIDPATSKLPKSLYPSSKYHVCFVFDLIFIAMRRPPTRQPFVMPMQNTVGVPPLAKGGQKIHPPAALSGSSVSFMGRMRRVLRGGS